MKLDNRRQIYAIWFRKLIATAIFVTLAVTFGYSTYFKNPVLGLRKTWYLAILGVVYAVLIAYNYLKRSNYVFFSDNGDKLVLRYYPTRLFNNKKNSIEMSKDSFLSYETEKFFFGRWEKLYMQGRYKAGISKYPGVSLSAVSSSDRKKIKAALDHYTKKAPDISSN
jgi:hypothetical protein